MEREDSLSQANLKVVPTKRHLLRTGVARTKEARVLKGQAVVRLRPQAAEAKGPHSRVSPKAVSQATRASNLQVHPLGIKDKATNLLQDLARVSMAKLSKVHLKVGTKAILTTNLDPLAASARVGNRARVLGSKALQMDLKVDKATTVRVLCPLVTTNGPHHQECLKDSTVRVVSQVVSFVYSHSFRRPVKSEPSSTS